MAQLISAAAQTAGDIKEIIEQMQEEQERQGPTLGPDLTIRQPRDEA